MTPGVAAMAAGAEEEEEERRLEKHMHQGCMAGFLHLFDRPQILSGKRLYHPRRLTSPNSAAGSTAPSEKGERAASLEGTPMPSPDMTPPAAPRPSLQLPVFDLKDGGGGGGMWRLREVPRLSLDSRAVVDAKGKLRPREIRTAAPAAGPPSPPAGDDRRSPSVIARLMGLDALPHGAGGDGGELRRSASERVQRDPSRYRFVDPVFFEKPAPAPAPPSKPSGCVEAALRRSLDPAAPRALQRRSHFDAREVFPEPAKRADAAASHGEIALYGEIERRLRKRGIAEPAKDLETLKQILEALQLKGLLHHAPPTSTARPPRRLSAETPPPPPIVVMRPSSRPPQPPPAARTTPARRIGVDAHGARRPRSPDPATSPARSPISPARRSPQSPQRRVSPLHSPKQQSVKKPCPDAFAVRCRVARRASYNSAAALAEDDVSTTFSDGGSSSCFSASSHWDFERIRADDFSTDRSLLERCGKLLSSIQAFTGGDTVSAADHQPSPVSVLDAASLLADEDSPSSSSASKRVIDFGASIPKPVITSDLEDDEWGPEVWMVGSRAEDADYAYVAEVIRLFDRMRDPDDVYKAVEKRRQLGGDTWQHRRLLCGAVAEVLDRWRAASPWDPVARLRGVELLEHVWAEVRRVREPLASTDDLNDLTGGAIHRDLAADCRWSRPTAEMANTVLQIERMVFKDLVADTIRGLADVALDSRAPRRKLVF